ncbi:type IV pilus modification PilV family protein, partial [Coxiella burnetii]
MSHSPSYGFTLLEVLIAWSILSGILLSVLFLQIDEVRHIRHAYYY